MEIKIKDNPEVYILLLPDGRKMVTLEFLNPIKSISMFCNTAEGLANRILNKVKEIEKGE